ncbi:MAG: hypothetical protein WCP29_01795 [Acidobacteriota bacterium]
MVVKVDQHLTFCADNFSFGPGDQAAPGILEVLWVAEPEPLRNLCVGLRRGWHRVTGYPTNICAPSTACRRDQQASNHGATEQRQHGSGSFGAEMNSRTHPCQHPG